VYSVGVKMEFELKQVDKKKNTNLHSFLQQVGMAYLYNQNCDMVATECAVNKDGVYTLSGRNRNYEPHELDAHYIIDVLGVGKKFIPLHLRDENVEWHNQKTYDNILRGIEVKVSRSDFRNGFVTTGCNYHYLLTPMRLINKADLPDWFGLLEYNKYKFSIIGGLGRFNIEGIRVVKRPKFRTITKGQYDRGVTSVSTRLSIELKINLSRYFRMLKELNKNGV